MKRCARCCAELGELVWRGNFVAPTALLYELRLCLWCTEHVVESMQLFVEYAERVDNARTAL